MGFDMIARIGADISDFSRKMAAIRAQLGAFSSFKGGLIGAGTLMAPSVIPMIAALGAGAVALGGSFAAAGIGVAAFGAVAVTALGKVFESSKELTEAQEELTKATTAEEREAALKKMEEAMAGLTDKQKEAVKSLQDFKSFWADFAKQFESPVVDVFTKSLSALKGVLQPMAPAISETAAAFSRLLDLFNQSLNAQPVKNFFDYLGNTAYERTMNFGMMFGNVMRGIMALMIAFDPLAADIEYGLVDMTAAFARWSEGLANSQGFQNFIEYVRTNGPIMLSVIGNIVSIIKSLVVAFAPFGQAVLSVINAISGFIAKLLEANPAIGTMIASIAMGIGAFMLFNPAVFAVIAVVGKIGLVMKMAADSTTLLGRAIAFLTGPIGIAIGVILALIGIFTYLFNTNEQFRTQVMAIWTEIQSMFASVLPSIMALVQVLATAFGQIASAILPMLATAIQSLLPVFQTVFIAVLQIVIAVLPVIISLIQTLIPIIIQLAMAVIPLILQAVQMVFPLVLQIIQSVLPIVIQLIQMLIPIILQIAQQIIPLILQAAQQVFPIVLALVQAAIPVVQAILAALCSFIESIVIPAIQIILEIVQEVFPAIQQVIQSAIDVIMGIIDFFVSALTGDWEGAWQAVEQITSSATDLVNSIVDAAMSALFEIVEAVLNDLGVPFESSWNDVMSYLEGIDLSGIGANIIQGLINGIGSMAGAVISKIQEVAGGIKEKMMSMLGIHSPSRWMESMIGENMILGWIKGIEGMKQSVMGTVAAMTGWMQPNLSNIQLGYNSSSAATVGAYTLPAAASNSKTQASANVLNNRPVVIENVIVMDSYEVARSTSGHIDTMQGNKVSTKNYLRGRKVEHNR